MSIPKPKGPVPDRDSDRRRRNKPESYGAAEVETAPAAESRPELGFAGHEMIVALWDVLEKSAEAKYYSDADWQRVRLELWYGDQLLTGGKVPGAQAWATFQAGLSELLVSPADKRRAGIELKPKAVDPDAEAAVAQIAKYRARLESA